jgi:hypothetical protein
MPNVEKIVEHRLVSRMIGFVPNCSASILVAVIVCHIDLRPKVPVAVMELSV